ncbi:MAG: cupredoxin domain-containing protein [Actinomycetota bacterium]
MHIRTVVVAAATVMAAWTGAAVAADEVTVEVAIKDHRFVPDRIEVPANAKFVLVVSNQDATPEEFESKELKREKVVKGGQQIRVNLGPLKPGQYKFFGEYHEDTAQGVVVAR